jgi:hypothetical protein
MTHGAKRKQCNFEGCTNHSQKGGVCYRHCANGGTNSNNNPTLQPSIDIIPAIPPLQSVNNEDEEELNSWILRSSCTNTANLPTSTGANSTSHETATGMVSGQSIPAGPPESVNVSLLTTSNFVSISGINQNSNVNPNLQKHEEQDDNSGKMVQFECLTKNTRPPQLKKVSTCSHHTGCKEKIYKDRLCTNHLIEFLAEASKKAQEFAEDYKKRAEEAEMKLAETKKKRYRSMSSPVQNQSRSHGLPSVVNLRNKHGTYDRPDDESTLSNFHKDFESLDGRSS